MKPVLILINILFLTFSLNSAAEEPSFPKDIALVNEAAYDALKISICQAGNPKRFMYQFYERFNSSAKRSCSDRYTVAYHRCTMSSKDTSKSGIQWRPTLIDNDQEFTAYTIVLHECMAFFHETWNDKIDYVVMEPPLFVDQLVEKISGSYPQLIELID